MKYSNDFSLLYFNINWGQKKFPEKNDGLIQCYLKYRCGLSKLMDSHDPIENTHESEDRNINNTNKNINN